MLLIVFVAGGMLSLSRSVICGVARAPAAVSQGGVAAITRYNSTAQVCCSLYLFKNDIEVHLFLTEGLTWLVYSEYSEEDKVWTTGR